MLVKLIKIGNSQGIRLPKSVLKQCDFQDEAELVIEDQAIILKPTTQPRSGWDVQFQKMHERGDDELLDRDILDHEETEDWEW